MAKKIDHWISSRKKKKKKKKKIKIIYKWQTFIVI
jgi:hypothetical protein